MVSSETKSANQETSGEPKHTPGHSTAVERSNDGQFMCPECGKTFSIEEAAERHLHGAHLEHLRKVHKEFHGQDVVGRHVS